MRGKFVGGMEEAEDGGERWTCLFIFFGVFLEGDGGEVDWLGVRENGFVPLFNPGHCIFRVGDVFRF